MLPYPKALLARVSRTAGSAVSEVGAAVEEEVVVVVEVVVEVVPPLLRIYFFRQCLFSLPRKRPN